MPAVPECQTAISASNFGDSLVTDNTEALFADLLDRFSLRKIVADGDTTLTNTGG